MKSNTSTSAAQHFVYGYFRKSCRWINACGASCSRWARHQWELELSSVFGIFALLHLHQQSCAPWQRDACSEGDDFIFNASSRRLFHPSCNTLPGRGLRSQEQVHCLRGCSVMCIIWRRQSWKWRHVTGKSIGLVEPAPGRDPVIYRLPPMIHRFAVLLLFRPFFFLIENKHYKSRKNYAVIANTLWSSQHQRIDLCATINQCRY